MDLPARLAFVFDLAGREDLPNAVALNSMQFNVARALGPALSGVLLRWFRPEACFLANAVSYGAVLWALALMDVTGAPRAGHQGAGLRALVEGFRYLARRRELAFLVLLAGTTALCGWPSQALLPALAQQKLGSNEVGYSWMLSATGLGALAAAWTVATVGSAEQRRRLLGIGVAVVSSALLALSCAPNLPVAVGSSAGIGFGLILFLATGQSVVQLNAADYIRGRVMGIWAMTLSGAVPLGNLLAGRAADWWGVPLVLQVLGISCALAAAGLFLLFRPGSRSSPPVSEEVAS